MKELLLHIGSTKTGSSSIQHQLWHNRQALEPLGILYPEVGVAGVAHHILGGALHPSAWHLHAAEFADKDRPKYFAELVEEVRKKADASSADRVVLSTEYWWGQLPEALFTNMEPLFKAFQVQIVCYVRRQDDWLESTYVQRVKSGETRTFREWLLRHMDQGPAFCFYDRILRQWEKYVPAERIHVRLYEPGSHFTDSVTDFLEFLHLSGQPTLKIARGDSNPSPTPLETEIIRIVNSCEMSAEQQQQVRLTLLRGSKKKHRYDSFHYLSADETIQLLKRYEASNAVVAKRYLKSPSGTLFNNPLPTPGEWAAWQGPTVDEVVGRIVRGMNIELPARNA